ncbi:hypothetical protein BD779DRAFT_1474371 [Infundibulicybe gibba]|nr:hypothetical protein BD779DRAFT_1474371 [Infundibulicybe gibba]
MTSLNWTNLVPQHFVNPGNGQDQLPAASLPATARGNVEPHYLLLARPTPLIEYNVALAPHTALANTFHANWPFEPATKPPVATMTITAPGLIPGPIVVHPSERNPAMVTISDILSAIHSALCGRVGPEEYPYIAQHILEGVLPQGWAERGITRLEVPNGRVKWAGLLEDTDELGNWKLVLENQ